jgi:hypothetical protein
MDQETFYPEQVMSPARVLDELQKELATNERLIRLLKRAAEDTEISLYRATARASSNHDALLGLTASAHAIMEFVEKITAVPGSSVSQPRPAGARR